MVIPFPICLLQGCSAFSSPPTPWPLDLHPPGKIMNTPCNMHTLENTSSELGKFISQTASILKGFHWIIIIYQCSWSCDNKSGGNHKTSPEKWDGKVIIDREDYVGRTAMGIDLQGKRRRGRTKRRWLEMRGDLRKKGLPGEERYRGECHPTLIPHKSWIIIKRNALIVVTLCVLLDIKRTWQLHQELQTPVGNN